MFFVLISFYSNSIFAANSYILKSVLDSPLIVNVRDIDKVEVIAAYYCLDCFDIKVSGRNSQDETYVVIHTEQDSNGHLKLTLINERR